MPAKAALIAILIAERPTCLDCISAKAGISVSEGDRYLTLISTSLEVERRAEDRCRICGNPALVYSLHRLRDSA